jgi:hypothetical protein
MAASGKNMTEFKTKQELLSALKDADARVTKWFEQIPAGDFFTRRAEAWSASDNLDHLIRAHKPIVKALNLPRPTLQAMFGKPDKARMGYEDLCRAYRNEIARGGAASGSFLPNQQTPPDAEAGKREIMERWSSISAELVARAEKWGEDELDQYQLPHPLLGNLSMREMLYFSLYHSLRHASLAGD